MEIMSILGVFMLYGLIWGVAGAILLVILFVCFLKFALFLGAVYNEKRKIWLAGLLIFVIKIIVFMYVLLECTTFFAFVCTKKDLPISQVCEGASAQILSLKTDIQEMRGEI